MVFLGGNSHLDITAMIGSLDIPKIGRSIIPAAVTLGQYLSVITPKQINQHLGTNLMPSPVSANFSIYLLPRLQDQTFWDCKISYRLLLPLEEL